ncbi:MAG: hypothetical protein D8M58_07445 [Calditrichaeota bacterium]|nr:MAG: hypothetical protein DWQ03_19045 [Calditrichota bacterium]MBL1205215.1 hypothetical protein [Calditrichota bacterium]NOG45045.1 hypothetical protein [Calditrichota bacterium]
MKVQELIEKREELESSIAKLLNKFHDDTDIWVQDIMFSCGRVSTLNDETVQYDYYVNASLEV